jgi:hypothetical protein
MATRIMALAAILTFGITACSDDDPTGPADPLAAFAGTWNASSFVYTSVDDPDTSIPILQVVPGSSVAVTVDQQGGFVAALNLGESTGGETVQIPGTIEHVSDGQIIVTFAQNPFFTQPLNVTYNFQTANTLSWEAPTTFDFNQDGTPTDAILTVVFQRN